MEIIKVNTRQEAEEQMKLSNSFKAPSSVSLYNRKMLDFYTKQYNYKRTKVHKGIDLYQPLS